MSGELWRVLRWGFVVAAVVGAWWSWRSSGDELGTALLRVDAWRLVVAQGLVMCGVALTGVAWRIALEAFVEREPAFRSIPPFFLAQVGKYIPGGVWSFAAQGALGARHGRSPRVPVAAALLFLGVHVASGLALGGIAGWWSAVPRWIVVLSLPAGVIGLTPALHRSLGRLLSGADCEWDWGRSIRAVLVMASVWGCYTAALVVLIPEPRWSLAVTLGTAFAVAHAAGVAVPIAPAGLGVRDAAFLLLITPVLGAGPAGAVTVLARLAHTVADFVLAGASWWLMRVPGDPRRATGQRVRD